jgi:hypothetical protein
VENRARFVLEARPSTLNPQTLNPKARRLLTLRTCLCMSERLLVCLSLCDSLSWICRLLSRSRCASDRQRDRQTGAATLLITPCALPANNASMPSRRALPRKQHLSTLSAIQSCIAAAVSTAGEGWLCISNRDQGFYSACQIGDQMGLVAHSAGAPSQGPPKHAALSITGRRILCMAAKFRAKCPILQAK